MNQKLIIQQQNQYSSCYSVWFEEIQKQLNISDCWLYHIV
jgi:hypothetical protein